MVGFYVVKMFDKLLREILQNSTTFSLLINLLVTCVLKNQSVALAHCLFELSR
jgi:hypothetical protein